MRRLLSIICMGLFQRQLAHSASYFESLSSPWNFQAADNTAEKALFLEEANDVYGYDGLLDEIRSKDTPHLLNQAYLDWTGSGVYRASQVDAMANDLKHHLYGNTHSHNPSSLLTEGKVEAVREKVLQYFNTSLSEYSVIFTSGATAALHLVSETFPWSNSSRFTYLEQSHNSVLGIRELCLQQGGDFCSMSESEIDFQDDPSKATCRACWKNGATIASHGHVDDDENHTPYHLFAFPAEDNFAGVKYNLDWIERIQKSGDGFCGKKGDWRVLLDAAAFVPTQRLDLYRYKPDFVAISFYKMFGFPTGLGALLVHKRSTEILQKVYWGGGSVVVAMTSEPVTIFKMNPCSKFEDGTLNFLSILALQPGFESFAQLGIGRISQHVWSLTHWTYQALISLTHSNGAPVVKVYGKHAQQDPHVQGGVISLNLLHPDGRYVGWLGVQKLAAKYHIHIRSGCACNPGGCQRALNLTNQDISTYFLNKDTCGDGLDVVKEGTLSLGAIRISFGSLTTFEDVQAWIQFVRDFYVDTGRMAPLGIGSDTSSSSSGGGGRVIDTHWAAAASSSAAGEKAQKDLLGAMEQQASATVVA